MNKEIITEYNNLLENLKKNIEQNISEWNSCNPVLSISNTYIKAIECEKGRMKNELNNSEHWKEYNEQYKKYFNERIKNNKISINNLTNINLDRHTVENYCNDIELFSKYLLEESSYDLFSHFKHGNNNYVLFGKNGAGKTTLLNKISCELIKTNSLIIPATRDIIYDNSKCYTINNENLFVAVKREEKDAMFLLSQCIRNKEAEEFRNHISEDKIITNKLKRIFALLDLDRVLEIDPDGKMWLSNENNDKYSLSYGSDGERTIVFILMVVLLLPENSFVFIDEPENHLNVALMKKLFDILEEERNDVIFIYATHNISFVESRKNCKLIYLEKSKKKNKWSFKDLMDHHNIPLDLILNMEGTTEDVIFCEGHDESSLDYKLYRILYPEYQISPVGGCENVTVKTKIINEYNNVFKRKAKGIIDNDYKNQIKFIDFKEKNISILKVNEVENLFLIDKCLTEIIEYNSLLITLEEAKLKIISVIKAKEKDIKKDFATKLLRNLHLKNKFDDVNDIATTITKINNENSSVFMKIYNNFISVFDEAISNKQYNELISLVPGKMLIEQVSKILGYNNASIYINNLLKLISLNEQLINNLKNYIML